MSSGNDARTDLRLQIYAPIVFHRIFVDWTGSVIAALMLSQLMYWTRRSGWGSWIYRTHLDWENEIGIGRKGQQNARRRLRESGLVEERLRGVPAKLYYRVVETEFLRRENKALMAGRTHPVGSNGLNRMMPMDPTIPEITIDRSHAGSKSPAGSERGLLFGDGEVSTPPIYSSAIKDFVKFTIKRQLHIHHKNPTTGEITYKKGAQKGGWSRHTLGYWESLYRKMDPDRVKIVLPWFIENFDDDYTPRCTTFNQFFQRFDQIEKAMERQKRPKRDVNGEPVYVEPTGNIIAWSTGPDGKRRRIKSIYNPELNDEE